MKRLLLVVTILTVVPATASAQQPASPKAGDLMIERYLAQETGRLSQRVLGGATTLEQWQAIRPRLRQEYLDMLGLWPLPEKTPLNAKITGTMEHEGVVIDKIHYQSKPGLYVTGNLYRPKPGTLGAGAKLPAVLYVCGHSGRGRDGNKSAFQDHGMWFAANGYVCLVIDTLQLGEIPGVHHGTYGRPFLHLKAYGIPDKDILENRWWWHSAGYTPAGAECWNGVRGIDYLISRADVDPDRIAVTGISGGGAATGWIAAADERVRVAVPVSGISDLESYVSNKVINGHCDCMFLINHHGWEWTTIPALVAPRPLLFANSDNDGIFPMDGNRRIISRLRTLYGWYGKSELVDEYVSKGGHDYRPDLRIAIFQFINKHLKKDAGAVKDAAFKTIPGKELRAFAEDKDIPTDAINIKIDETFVPRANVDLPKEGGFAAWKAPLVQQLRQRPFRAFPDRIPEAVKSRTPSSPKSLLLTTEPSIEVRVGNVSPETIDAKTGTVIVLGPDEEAGKVPDWAKSYVGDGAVMLLTPRGFGESAWTGGRPPNYVERSHVLLGRTVDEGRVWDIAATVRYLHANDGKRWQVAGRGQAGILAAYAAIFEPSIAKVVAVDPPASHRAAPTFLSVLRVLDVPDALGLLAPTPLTLVNAKDTAFDKTARIYQRAGAEAKLQRK